jgi:geranylgeranyl diphosphate synthase type I
VASVLTAFVSSHRQDMAKISIDTLPLVDSLAELLEGGKRLRPAFAYWGYRASGGADTAAVVSACASLEFLQACALIHDDVMDASDTRRGKPAAHRQFANLHAKNQWSGSSEAFGVGAAILIGDLALSWADELLLTSGLSNDQVLRAKDIYDEMRTELMAGQYLDLLEQVRGNVTVERAATVIRFKSAKYTIERPLLMGAAIAGSSPEIADALSKYGLALGEAFQLRDDVLGVFGDQATTGKPTGDDLREGKQTMLIAYASGMATPQQLAMLNSSLGDADLSVEKIAELQQILITCGALDLVEKQIVKQTAAATEAIANIEIPADARLALTELAIIATKRES